MNVFGDKILSLTCGFFQSPEFIGNAQVSSLKIDIEKLILLCIPSTVNVIRPYKSFKFGQLCQYM